ncbi:ornithine--oxo-acid transaminase [Desulforamulus aquiferis]|uniref:ornithine aminotransferase n=1 Tax=Desulforamulus aquiferis TaxID=1397668 RepID=A0AAW7Z7K8_9FIRM|nr:ornithine--oxo-acid transaminase [Desulforamulus aquiferis]MDO7785765.1 ornithine--oxo-acid transaminase [Desulforamulus aquiferis]
MSDTQNIIQQTEKRSAHNYYPLPIVINSGNGAWVYDVEGKKYLDMLSAYSALNQGHLHPRIIARLIEQAQQLTLTSRAFYNDKMGQFLESICQLSGFEKALPMNTGSEAVETAIKAARKWGYLKKGIQENLGEIIVCNNNFAGRTVTIISFSTEDQYRLGFGPYTPGFKAIPFGDAKALEEAITPNTIGFLVEPIQGEGGVVVPPEGYLQEIREITRKHNLLLILDEVQTGLGRTGEMFAFQHEKITPDILILGKALGGGVYPVSVVLADNEIMDVFTPGDHGSTFGGNPLAAAVGIASIEVLIEENLPQRAMELGSYFMDKLININSPLVKEIRGKGLMIGVEIKEEYGTARPYCERLMQLGVLCKETHQQTIRFAPPLIITREDIDWALEKIKLVLDCK